MLSKFSRIMINYACFIPIFIGTVSFVGCSGSYRGNDFHIQKVVEQEKGVIQVLSRKDLEAQAVKKLKSAGRYDQIEWEVEKTMLPSYGLITYDPSYESEITYLQIENSVFSQSCNEKRDKKNADYSGDESGPITILPIPGVGVFVGVNASYGKGSKQSFYYFFCKPRSNLPDSTTICMKNKMDKTINKYIVTWKKSNEKNIGNAGSKRMKGR